MKEQRRAKKEKASASFKAAAVSFEVNPYYEQLLEMREKKPAAYRTMSTATRLAVEAYIKAKEAAAGEVVRKAAA
ncbi:MAG: hypothetical protein ICV60_04615 [Pyrinomonadaceae bacterium]|nr:hypothetical protein [Pyrinomonadaceae bacterium]